MPTKTYTATIDVSNPETAIQLLEKLIKDMGDVEVIIISAGTGYLNPSLSWSQEKDTIDTNVSGFTAMAGVAIRYFMAKEIGPPGGNLFHRRHKRE